MHRIRITHAPETLDGEVMAHWQPLLGCKVEADGQSVSQIRKIAEEVATAEKKKCELPLPPPRHHEVYVGDLIEALPASNTVALQYWGKLLTDHVYLVFIPYDCAEIVESVGTEPVTSADWMCQTR